MQENWGKGGGTTGKMTLEKGQGGKDHLYKKGKMESWGGVDETNVMAPLVIDLGQEGTKGKVWVTQQGSSKHRTSWCGKNNINKVIANVGVGGKRGLVLGLA